MELKAIYRPIPADRADQQETLVYNTIDGFSWIKSSTENNWTCYASTAVEAETLARESGFDPVAITYLEG